MSAQLSPLLSPARILDELGENAAPSPGLAALRDQLVAAARDDVARHPVFPRPVTLDALRASPSIRMKYREQPAHLAHLDAAGWERFALSLGDSELAKSLAERLPRLAAAVRLTRDPGLADYVCRQLAELASWSPFVRPGWSGSPDPDGAWLGTGWATRAITESLALLPPGVVPDDLADRIADRLRAEIAGIRDDWRTKPNWFTRTEAAYSNQWALPTEALILASLHLGLDRHRDDYEFGVANLLRTLDAQGPDGEFSEGLEYGFITLESVLAAARAAALVAGDTRLLDHPFLQKFPVWYLHHLQPAGFVVNAFDARVPRIDRGLVATLALATGHPAAVWYLRAFPPAAVSLSALLAGCALAGAGQTLPPALPPPLYAGYPVATRVNWIESWDVAGVSGDPVSGFWMRGGHASDAHDHQDRGHVNFIVKNRPVLIEAGLFSYGILEHPTHFKSVAGHNVLQVGGWEPERLTPEVLASGAGQILDAAHRVAPLTIHRLDAEGGDVSVDGSACYAGVRRWIRRVTWDAASVVILDAVELRAPDTLLFRWHLGVPADTASTIATGRVRVGDIEISYDTPDGVPLVAELQSMPDNTLTVGTLTRHATVVIRTARPETRLTLRTRAGLHSA